LKKLTFISTLILAGMINIAHAGNSDCATKRAALEKEIGIAQHYGNSAKVNGLQQALAEVKAHCTNESVIASAQRDIAKLEKKLAEKQADIREAEADLREAQANGQQNKVAKYQRKISEKQADLQEIKQELAQARAELAALQK
jgi:chromosome segregation ATPase